MTKKLNTDYLLDLCRNGVSLNNEITLTASQELCSYIVANSLLSYKTSVPEILLSRVSLLENAKVYLEKYPRDIFEESAEVKVEIKPENPFDGPQLA